MLALVGEGGDVGGQEDIVHPGQGALAGRFLLADVQGRAGDLAFLQGPDQSVLVDHLAARGVDDKGALFHPTKPFVVEQAPGFRRQGQMAGDKAVGIYAAAVRISEVWYFVPMAIVASVFPAILEAKKRSKVLYYARLQKLYDLMVVISVSIALPMTFMSTPLVNFLFGEAYLGAGTVLAIHIWASVFVFLGVASSKWFLAENRQILSMHRTVLGAVANVGLNLWLIPQYGAVGAALTTVLSYAIAAFLADVLQQETRTMFSMKASALNPLSVLERRRK